MKKLTEKQFAELRLIIDDLDIYLMENGIKAGIGDAVINNTKHPLYCIFMSLVRFSINK